MSRTNTAQRIVTHATELFRAKGYHATSMNDIANGIGLKKASLYNHFPSKEMIAKAVVQAVDAEFKQNFFDIAHKNGRDATERFSSMMDWIYQYFQEKNGCIIASLSMGESDDSELPMIEIRQFTQQWIDALSHVLETKYSKEEAEQLAKNSLVRIQGSLIVRRIDGASGDVLRLCCDDLLALLR